MSNITPEELRRHATVLQRMLDRLDSEYDAANQQDSEDYFQIWEEWCAIKGALEAADTIEHLKARITELEQMFAAVCDDNEACGRRIAELEQWKSAVIDEAVVHWTYKAEHENDPRAAINALMCDAQQIALDPSVSPEAKALHDKIHELEDLVNEAEARANERGRRIVELEKEVESWREDAEKYRDLYNS